MPRLIFACPGQRSFSVAGMSPKEIPAVWVGAALIFSGGAAGREGFSGYSGLFWERQKKEQLFARAPEGQDALKLCGSAFYISDGTMLPFLLSDRGYGISFSVQEGNCSGGLFHPHRHLAR